MKIVACPDCHTQYDVTRYAGDTLQCPCGTVVQKANLQSRPAEIRRCGSCGAAVTADETHCSYCSSKIERESTRFTLICPECYARNPRNAVFCTDCGVRFEPQQPPAAEDLLTCPACAEATTMAARVIGGFTVQECPACRGLWIPEDRLDRLVDQAVQAASRRGGPTVGRHLEPHVVGKVTYRKCPVCGDSMQRKNFARRSGVIVDWCGHHGTWLDTDELEAIAAFVLAEGAGRSVPEDWHLQSTDKRFRAIAAEHLPEFSSPPEKRGRKFGGVNVFFSHGVVNGDDVVEGFVDWISDLLSND